MEETILSTEKIYDGRVVKLSVHMVRLPDGNTSEREVVQHPGAVAMVTLDADHNILLVRQFRLPAGKVLWEIPAGTLEADEDPADCAARELQEEAGYKPTRIESLGGLYTAPGYTSEFIHLFLVTEFVESSLDTDADEFIEASWIPLDKALTMIEQGEIADGKTICGILRARQHVGN